HLTVNQRVLGSSPRGRAKKEVYRKIDLFFVSALLPPASKIEGQSENRNSHPLLLFTKTFLSFDGL
ncbi:hypothetical protein KTR07_05530, partial [Bacteroides sp. MSK.20.82]|uniref:hypothetical protein n=1 Tax=Bacteroides sp. MSK.20.82 TaxID=2849174 RepID=UPI001C2BDF3E